MKDRVLIVDDVHEILFNYLSKAPIEWSYQPNISKAELHEQLPGCAGLVIRSKCELDQQLLRNANTLKFIARAGAGLDNIDEKAATAMGIQLINAPEGNRDAVGEHACGMLLSLLNHFARADRQVRQGLWDREGNRGRELSSLNVGIIGYGNTGRCFARKLRGFGCRIMAYDKYKHGFAGNWVEECSMQQLHQEADVISLHVPLTAETQFLINDKWLSSFHKPIILLNLSRGKVASLRAINWALDHGIVTAFAADVLENENLDSLDKYQKEDFNALISRDNVLLTPHVGGWSTESYRKISIALGRKILSLYGVKNR